MVSHFVQILSPANAAITFGPHRFPGSHKKFPPMAVLLLFTHRAIEVMWKLNFSFSPSWRKLHLILPKLQLGVNGDVSDCGTVL